jgi:hypothetical protein
MKRKCDKCPAAATLGRIVYKDGLRDGRPSRVPDYAEFVCDAHSAHRGGTPWGSVEHAARWEDSDVPEDERDRAAERQ